MCADANCTDASSGVTRCVRFSLPGAPTALAPPDFDCDGNVGILDLLALLANWGPCV